MNDDPARPSLILAEHERAHREHLHQHQQHHHNLKHRGQADSTATAIQSVVTEVTATISVIQQIDVDSNGSTFSIQTVLANSTPAATESSETSTVVSTSATPGSVSSTPSSASSTNAQGSQQISSASQSLNSSISTSSSSTLSTSSSFTSLIPTANTTLISSSSSSLSATPNFSNSSISSTTSSSSSFTFLSTSSFVSSEESSTSSTSSLYSPSSSSQTTSINSGAGGIGGGTAGSTASTATSTAGSGSGSGPSTSSTPTPVVVGGVVGSVAGAAILIFLLLAFIRWKKRHQSMLQLGSGNEGPSEAVTSRDGPPPDAPSGAMTERRSLAFVPAALANLTGFNKRSSRQTDRTISSTAGSERGFYRVSGRKLPSVLQSGGDGYGDGIPESNTLSGTSFYQDSQGFYGGAGSPSAAGPSGIRPESGVPVMRPSPARTPVTQQGPFSAAPAPLTPPRRPDGLGRSHPSQDGSHTSSRFTEDV